MRDITLATTMDTDVHAFHGNMNLIRAKVERNDWIMTTDERLVRSNAIVCIWEPTDEELESFMEDVNR